MDHKNMENRKVSKASEPSEKRLGFFRRMKESIEAIREKDPAAEKLNGLTIWMTYPGLRALTYHRVNHWFYERGMHNTARILSDRARTATGIEIHPGATIGRRVVIDHGMGIVIGETAEIGNDVLMYKNVTLGGTGHDVGKRHPTIGDGVMLGTNATILGPIKIGDNSYIGAGGAPVTKNVPPNSTVLGPVAEVVKMNGEKIDPLAHDKIRDVVSEHFTELRKQIASQNKQIAALKAEVAELQGQKKDAKPPSE